MRGMGQGPRAVTVAATSAGSTASPITAPCRLLGWSLAPTDVSGPTAVGSVTAPTAAQVICSAAAVPPGEYIVNWVGTYSGTVGAPEIDNIGLYVGATLVATANIRGASGEQPQVPVQIVVPAGGATVSMKAIGNSTAASVYTCSFYLSGGPPAECVILDGQQTIGVVSMNPGSSATSNLAHGGVYVSGPITVQVNAGTISGCIYVLDNPEPT